VIAHAQMIVLGLDVRIDHLVVEKLGALGRAGDAPLVVIDQTPEEPKLSLLVEYFNPHQVFELLSERPDRALQTAQVRFDLRPEQLLDGLTVELSRELGDRMRGISDELRKCGAETGLRAGPLEHDDIKDLYLVEPVELGREELGGVARWQRLRRDCHSARRGSPAGSI